MFKFFDFLFLIVSLPNDARHGFPFRKGVWGEKLGNFYPTATTTLHEPTGATNHEPLTQWIHWINGSNGSVALRALTTHAVSSQAAIGVGGFRALQTRWDLWEIMGRPSHDDRVGIGRRTECLSTIEWRNGTKGERLTRINHNCRQ